MAFNKANFYQEGNSEEYFLDRTNPTANPANAIILKTNECCEGFELNVEFELSGTSLTGTFGSPTSTYDTRYIKVIVNDGNGNFVSNVGTGNVSSIVVDTTGLTAGATWQIQIVIETTDSILINCPCMADYTIYFAGNDGNIVSVDTTTLYAQRLSLFKADGTTAVADGGTYALGSFTAGGTEEPFSVVVKNTGSHVLTISSVSFTSDVTSFVLPQYAGVVFPNQALALNGKVDSSGIAGSYTGTITLNSDDPTNAVYTIDIDYTLA
jgi:hypothetical protein